MDDKDIINSLEEKCRRLEDELRKSREELEVQIWGTNKTNDAIKALYKELEKKNNELRELDHLKSEFINTVSHELRTPLTTIKESVSQILDGLHGPVNETQQDFLAICLEDIERLRGIVDDLLDVSKIEAGKFKIAKQEVDIVSLARKVMAAFKPQLMAKNLELKENISCAKADAYVDKDSIIRVFTNLIGNAVKFTDSGSIEVSVSDKYGRVECYCLDTGRGIAEEDLARVFGKFEQFGRTDGPGQKGTGLGLNISKSIVELNRGKIWIESALNKGTKVSFSLPKYNIEQLYIEYIEQPFKNSVRDGKNFSLLVFGIKDRVDDSALGCLESLVRRNLRNDDGIIRFKQRLIVPLLEVAKAKALEIGGRICRNVRTQMSKDAPDLNAGVTCEVISYPEDGLTQESVEGGKFLGHA